MNKCVLSGRLTADPETRQTKDQTPVCSFTLAVDRRGEGADFISCTAFGKTAENIGKFFSKGKPIAISGRITTGSYTKNDGTKVYTTSVTVEEFDFIESKKKEQEELPFR